MIGAVAGHDGRQSPSSFFSSPLSINFFPIARPTDERPLMKTSGKVGHPIHIFKFVQAGSGAKIWADGVREADCRLLEAKMVMKPEISPFVDSSNTIHELIRAKMLAEFSSYAAIIRDPSSPAIALEVITNDARAVPFFKSLLRELQIPGEVVVRPFP